MMLPSSAFLDDNNTDLLERPVTVTAPHPDHPVQKTAAPAEDFRQAACRLPQEARFTVDLVAARPWESCDRLAVGMVVGRKTRLRADDIPLDALPGDTVEDKKKLLRDVYTAACRSLSITFERNTRTPSGWRVERPDAEGEGSDFVMLHHGIDRLRALVATNAGTQARRMLGWNSGLHERSYELLAPFYRL